MEHFVVSAIKYRPKTFKDVVGQQAITNSLLNAIEHNHLAQALLFCGPRGVGKTTCARILAKKINQDSQTREDEDFAFNIFELDAASNNSVDDIRSLIDQVRIPPQTGKYKVYIIDEVHMLSQAAFNAFLKTLEEPPRHAIFILATTEKHKIIPTILSRCQIFDFKRITVRDAREYLAYIAHQQGIEAEEEALHIIAQKADGAMRDALSIFDRVVSFSGKKLTLQAVTENLNVLDYQTYFQSTDLILQGDIPGLLRMYNEILGKGFDGHHYIAGLAAHFRDLLVARDSQTVSLLEVGEETQMRYLDQSKRASMEFLLQAIDTANDCDFHYKQSTNQRLHVELCLMKLASILSDGEKKNDRHYIVPPSAVKSVPVVAHVSPESLSSGPSEVKNEVKKEPGTGTQKTSSESEDHIQQNPSEGNPKTTETPKDDSDSEQIAMAVSGLSIKSIKAKKILAKQQTPSVSEKEALPQQPFTREALKQHWQEYAEKMDRNGRKILASTLSSNIPELVENHSFRVVLPNDTMKKELEQESYPLLEYLKAKLNNHAISLHLEVNEEIAKQYAFTPREKFEKMAERNPNLELLRKTFDLDV